jgi:hypothetical protein
MESAAERRLWDAFVLAASHEGAETSAVYLLGYVAEIVLKTAFYRERGLSRFVDTAAARRLARSYRAAYRRSPNDHDLQYWLFVLERIKSAHGRRLSPAFLGAVALRIGLLADNWNESLRYRDARPTPAELNQVLDSVEWIWKNRKRLWR